MADDLRFFALFGDDFAYIAESRDATTTLNNLLAPHNTHVVPLFRLWTFALVALAGHLANLQAVFGAASYVGLVSAMLAVGQLVMKEFSRAGVALTVMAGLGVSTVVMPAVTWYSAGQALWAGAAVVVTLVLVRNWSLKGGGWRFALAVLGAALAPAIWAGGHVAGLAGAAYLGATGQSRCRRPALALVGVAASAILLELVLVRREIQETTIIWEHRRELWPRPIQGVLHTAQAVIEALLFGNLGLDTITTPLQASTLTLGLVGLWAWSRGGWRRVMPLEAAGAAIVLFGYLMPYTFRGNLPFSSLRSAGWYHAIPQIGAVLLAAGWWVGLTPLPAQSDPRRLTRRGALIVLGLILLLSQMQTPRAERFLLAEAPPMTASEKQKFPIAELQRLRALYFREDHRDRQFRHLARLDAAQRVCARLRIGPGTIRREFGRILMPGISELQGQSDVVSIMAFPNDAGEMAPAAVRSALGSLLPPEPAPRPAWLSPKDTWPAPP